MRSATCHCCRGKFDAVVNLFDVVRGAGGVVSGHSYLVMDPFVFSIVREESWRGDISRTRGSLSTALRGSCQFRSTLYMHRDLSLPLDFLPKLHASSSLYSVGRDLRDCLPSKPGLSCAFLPLMHWVNFYYSTAKALRNVGYLT